MYKRQLPYDVGQRLHTQRGRGGGPLGRQRERPAELPTESVEHLRQDTGRDDLRQSRLPPKQATQHPHHLPLRRIPRPTPDPERHWVTGCLWYRFPVGGEHADQRSEGGAREQRGGGDCDAEVVLDDAAKPGGRQRVQAQVGQHHVGAQPPRLHSQHRRHPFPERVQNLGRCEPGGVQSRTLGEEPSGVLGQVPSRVMGEVPSRVMGGIAGWVSDDEGRPA